MREHFRLISKPENYHGKYKKDNFFEGWYFKIVDSSEENIYAVIPGIFKSKDSAKEHAFIQVINGRTNESHYVRYPSSAFKFNEEVFEIEIAENFFSQEEIKVDIKNEDVDFSINAKFANLKKWPFSKASPGPMGWYAYLPVMECYHGVLSMNHRVDGCIRDGLQYIDIENGKGYIEKDWGTNFPSSYIWVQSNHFGDRIASVVCSVAKIPWLGSSFRGFLCGMLLDDKFYKFATYNGSKVESLNIHPDSIIVKLRNRKYSLEIKALGKRTGAKLFAPFERAMLERVVENLDGKLEVKLADNNNNIIFDDTGFHAGIEANGKLSEIATKLITK